MENTITHMGNHLIPTGDVKLLLNFFEIIDIFNKRSKILPNMFRDKASILMEAKSKRKPNSATSVVGFGLVLRKQEKEKKLL